MTLIIELLKSVILLLVCKSYYLVCTKSFSYVLNIQVHSKSLVDISRSLALSQSLSLSLCLSIHTLHSVPVN